MSAHALECQRTWRPRKISRPKFPKRTRILSIPSKTYFFHSVHSAIGSRMNGMIFRSFRKQNSSQKKTNTVYSEYSYSGIFPKERALRKSTDFRLPTVTSRREGFSYQLSVSVNSEEITFYSLIILNLHT